jgi:hypothetical protein
MTPGQEHPLAEQIELEGACLPIREEGERPMAIEIHNDRPITIAFPPGPVVNADMDGFADGRKRRLTDQHQDAIASGRQSEHSREMRATNPAGDDAKVLLHLGTAQCTAC